MNAAKNWTPWGDVAPVQPVIGNIQFAPATSYAILPRTAPAANDNHPRVISEKLPLLGITGMRNVGKSTVANILRQYYGFTVVHAFESGKLAAVEYFRAIGCPDPHEMVYGHLKDVPSPYLPDNVAPRFYLEKSGHFHGATLGVDWTLGMEIKLAGKRNPGAPIVVESLVYEAPWFKRNGGFVLRLIRPNHKGPAGTESDAVQEEIKADATISAANTNELAEKTHTLVQQIVGGG